MDETLQNATAHAREQPTHAREESGKRMRQGAFLVAYAKLGRIGPAALAADVDRTQHYRWLKESDYAEQFAEAYELATTLYEDEAGRRAMGDGCEPSDRMMEFILKSRRPDVYRDRASIEHTGEIHIKRLEGVNLDDI